MTLSIQSCYDRLVVFAEGLKEQHRFRLSELEYKEIGWELVLRAVSTLPYENLSQLIAADPDRKQHCLQTEVGSDWLQRASDSTELVQRLATMVVVAKLRELCKNP